MEIAAIGTTDFLLGFELAGVGRTYAATKETLLDRIGACADAGIIIVDETLAAGLSPAQRAALETSIAPVIILLAKNGAPQMERLRRELRNTLGVDLLR